MHMEEAFNYVVSRKFAKRYKNSRRKFRFDIIVEARKERP